MQMKRVLENVISTNEWGESVTARSEKNIMQKIKKGQGTLARLLMGRYNYTAHKGSRNDTNKNSDECHGAN
jgi:hypothetical protein